MDKETSDMIKLIYSGISNQSTNVVISNLDRLITIASQHHCITMIYYALTKNKIELTNTIYDTVTNTVLNEIIINEQQLFCINELSNEFNTQEIDHIFLKGSVLKNLYPHTEIRRMGDIDILIKESQYPKISETLKALGYYFAYESDYEIVWKKNCVNVELHRVLIPSYNKDLYSYFGNGWKRAVKKNKSCYIFSNEDMFIYIFSHFAKHYRDAGIGIIHICDLYIMLNSFDLDFEYITKELKKLHLYEFWCNIKETIQVWFAAKENTAMTEHITKVILNSGVYGLKYTSNISKALKSKKKYGSLQTGKLFREFKYIFPPYSSMKRKYQILKKIHILLPFFWIIRWITIIFINPQKIKYTLSNISNVTDSEIISYQKNLEYVGLDYNF